MERFKIHATKVGFRIYDYKKFDYVKDNGGNYLLYDNKSKVTEKLTELKLEDKKEIEAKLLEEQKKLEAKNPEPINTGDKTFENNALEDLSPDTIFQSWLFVEA